MKTTLLCGALSALTRALFPSRTFQSGGSTDDPLFIWSGDVFMSLPENEALKTLVETLQGIDCLLIETGGFNTKGGPDWKAPWMVMTRQ